MLKWGGCTDVGKARPVNEDGYYFSVCSEETETTYAMVADGMGGHLAGEVASTMAIRQISEHINAQYAEELTIAATKKLLVKAIKKANSEIYQKSRKDMAYHGMGTTLTLCFTTKGKAIVAHVGDSRAYLMRHGELHQITTDHSLVQELLSGGQITAKEAATHPQKNVITRALGTDAAVDIDLYEFELTSGDLVLLSTDGLTNMLQDAELVSLLAERPEQPVEEAAKHLVLKANEKGGHDNITAVLGRSE